MSNCIFCKIINGDFGTEFVYENDSAVVFKDINPKADTHLLVVPRLHVESLNELNDKDLLGELMMTVKAVTEKLDIKSFSLYLYKRYLIWKINVQNTKAYLSFQMKKL